MKNFSTLNSQLSTPKGFTFIELILVVALVLILGTMGTALTARFMTQNAVANAQDQLVGDLRKAQMSAMVGKQGDSWGVYYGANKITLYRGDSYGSRVAGFDETFSVPGGVTIVPSSFDVNFARITGKTSAISINISGSGTEKTVMVNEQGAVTR